MKADTVKEAAGNGKEYGYCWTIQTLSSIWSLFDDPITRPDLNRVGFRIFCRPISVEEVRVKTYEVKLNPSGRIQTSQDSRRPPERNGSQGSPKYNIPSSEESTGTTDGLFIIDFD